MSGRKSGLSGQIGQWMEAKSLKRLGVFGLALTAAFRAAREYWMLLCLSDKDQDQDQRRRTRMSDPHFLTHTFLPRASDSLLVSSPDHVALDFAEYTPAFPPNSLGNARHDRRIPLARLGRKWCKSCWQIGQTLP